MRSRRWRSIQSGLPESAHDSPELVKHASLVEVDGMSRNIVNCAKTSDSLSEKNELPIPVIPSVRKRVADIQPVNPELHLLLPYWQCVDVPGDRERPKGV